MTREQVNAVLRHMEHVRELSLEAETQAEERRLDAEYGRLSASIRPYLTGRKPYSDAPPSAPITPPRTPEAGQRPSTPEDGQTVTTRQEPTR